jgi:hypothetical protein
MKNSNAQIIFEFLRKLAVIKRVEITSEALSFMAQALDNFEPSRVEAVCRKFMITKKFFPDISEFFEELSPQETTEDKAQLTVGKILEAVNLFGYMGAEKAASYLGEDWNIVISFGGWNVICETPFESMGTMRAQLRELAKSIKRKHTSIGISEQNLKTIATIGIS